MWFKRSKALNFAAKDKFITNVLRVDVGSAFPRERAYSIERRHDFLMVIADLWI